ncbi:SIS domain-containing protein [Rossellomorea marisflavi]|uniref:MurR/RpiR family transcriptional regulator n=1 Tax=Rossellomorea marisflavi TaxID=189381 RepID=UPI001318C3C8|nr:MurR/RpiR family transcriptional regulator [Rossellomorea marisflavi]QHA36464.1 SIS domain-containing protein [Rossellomorea marisflavi]
MYNFFAKLQNFLESSSDHSTSDHTIAEYILRNLSAIPSMTIYQLASACHLSPATVSRFCRKFENITFKELKEQASEFIDFNRNEIQSRSLPSSLEAVRTYFEELTSSLEETEALLNEQALQDAVELITKAEKLSFFGVTFSNVIARNAQIKFMRLGKYTASYGNHENQLIEAESLQPDDTAIVISFSGDTRFIVKLTKVLKKKKIPIIALTGNSAGHLAQMADVILRTSTEKLEAFKSPLIEEINLQVLINTLYMMYSASQGKK